MAQLSIGSISHGTLLSKDLASAIADTLANVGHNESDILMRDLRNIAEGNDHSEIDDGIIAEGIDALQDYCPAFCYAGMHEGDGSDLGVWPDFDALESAVAEGDVIKIDDLSDLDSLAVSELNGANMAMVANDHGNVTLYELHIAARSVWACV